MTGEPLPYMKRYPVALTDPAHPGHSTHEISSEGRTAQRVWGNKLPERLESKLINRCLGTRIELCGFITDAFEPFYVVNVHHEPTHNFYMEPGSVIDALEAIYDAGQEVIGQFHFHPNGVTWPSPRDLHGWPNPELGWRYWIVTPREIIEWQLVERI